MIARTTPSPVLQDGVDSLASGDFNGDRILDIAVAGREGGNYVVTIYDCRGSASGSMTTANVLATLVNPLGPGVGPISLAAGDFAGTGVSELAMAPESAEPGVTPTVSIIAFSLTNPTQPSIDAPVTATQVASFQPAGLAGAKGLNLAAGDLTGAGADQLAVAPVAGANALDVYAASTTGDWALEHQLSLATLHIKGGASLSAGPLASGDPAELVVGSTVSSVVSIVDPADGAVRKVLHPFKNTKVGVRVALVASGNGAGALVVTPQKSGSTTPAPLLYSLGKWTSKAFAPLTSPGGGQLIPLGGGFVEQRSSIEGLSSSFPYSPGPMTPTVLFASTSGSELVVQGAAANDTPNKLDQIEEPILALATPTASFTPLEQAGDMPGLSAANIFPAVAYPSTIVFHAVNQIVLPDTPSIYAGLPSTNPLSGPDNGGWGPNRPKSSAPAIPTGVTDLSDWLRQHVLAAYSQAIGVSYQHHHNPFWAPSAKGQWNTEASGYPTLGIDCTNLTAWAYDVALGIQMNSATPTQAAISPTNTANITIPAALKPYVKLETLTPAGDTLADYNAFVKELEPGDILYIDPNKLTGTPSDPAGCTHAITWLGQYGVDKAATGADSPNLIVDSTGNAPVHYDSENHVIPPGVEVRPFAPPTSAINSWYFNHVDHALRIIYD